MWPLCLGLARAHILGFERTIIVSFTVSPQPSHQVMANNTARDCTNSDILIFLTSQAAWMHTPGHWMRVLLNIAPQEAHLPLLHGPDCQGTDDVALPAEAVRSHDRGTLVGPGGRFDGTVAGTVAASGRYSTYTATHKLTLSKLGTRHHEFVVQIIIRVQSQVAASALPPLPCQITFGQYCSESIYQWADEGNEPKSSCSSTGANRRVQGSE